MAMIRVEPVDVDVRTNWFDGRPRQITWGEQRLPVMNLVRVRDETAAFPAVVGPRTVFEVQTPLARLTLAYRHRTRRWTIEGLDEVAKAARRRTVDSHRGGDSSSPLIGRGFGAGATGTAPAPSRPRSQANRKRNP